MKRLLFAFLVLFFLCLVPRSAHAAIGYDSTGSCASSNAATCTPTATVSGEVGIVLATRSGSTTAPTCPSGWTCPAGWTSSGGSGSTAISWRAGCKKFTTTNDTSGSWTNAGNVVLQSYSGSNVGNVATCDLTFGGTSFTSAASATLTYTTITMTHTDSSSWVIALGGSRTATNVNQAPTGTTGRTASGTTDMVAGNDTNGGVASWSTQTITVNASTRNIGAVFELLAPCPGPWCAIQHAENTCASGTTCAVTLSSTTAGQLAVVTLTGAPGATPTISGVSAGLGTFVHCSNCSANDGFESVDMGYVASIASGQTSVTVTLSVNPGNAYNVAIFVYSYTYSSISLDTSGSGTDTTCTSCAGIGLTLTGSNDVIVQCTGTGSTTVSISSPYTDFAPNNVNFTAGAINTASGTAPTWTLQSGVTANAAMAFKQTPAAGGCSTHISLLGAGQC